MRMRLVDSKGKPRAPAELKGGEPYVLGVPMREISWSDWLAIDPDLRAVALANGLYSQDSGNVAPAVPEPLPEDPKLEDPRADPSTDLIIDPVEVR